MRRSLGRMVVLMAVTSMLLPVQAEARWGSSVRSNGFHIMRYLNRLNLTESQRLQVKQIAKRHRIQQVELLEKLVKAREYLQEVMQNDNATDEEITSAWNKVASIKGKMLLLKRSMRRDVMKILNPDQRLQLKEVILLRQLNNMRGRQRINSINRPSPLRSYDGF